jgi:hypothetical protein
MEVRIMNDVIYQASDLASSKRVEFLRDARAGGARLRDRDGSSLLFLPEKEVETLKAISYWSKQQLQLTRLLDDEVKLTPSALGDLAWLRVFGRRDLVEFRDELHEVLIAAISDGSPAALEECIQAWRVTARQLEDPLRKSVLIGQHDANDFVEVTASPAQHVD